LAQGANAGVEQRCEEKECRYLMEMAMDGKVLADEEMRKGLWAVPFKSNGALAPATRLLTTSP
jgi:hypothetical protein